MTRKRLSPPPIFTFLRYFLPYGLAAVILTTMAVGGGFEFLVEQSGKSESFKALIGIGFLVATLSLFYAWDKLLLRYIHRRYGHDPHALHWSERLNRDGNPFCPDCGSLYMTRPESGIGGDFVRCGDCGFAIATLEEMQPLFEAHVEEWNKPFKLFK